MLPGGRCKPGRVSGTPPSGLSARYRKVLGPPRAGSIVRRPTSRYRVGLPRPPSAAAVSRFKQQLEMAAGPPECEKGAPWVHTAEGERQLRDRSEEAALLDQKRREYELRTAEQEAVIKAEEREFVLKMVTLMRAEEERLSREMTKDAKRVRASMHGAKQVQREAEQAHVMEMVTRDEGVVGRLLGARMEHCS
eukprot:TRINITY_DN27871_c0_g1_i1.p2 TRINITY_DN27871_c0_g1~~TRINITY_DN27871_c0_g1_i1.p2  ORF type:complete len:193 (-),score=32.67 TRINITY_DN27871_c0_g1_i1:257-835(-)